MTLEIITSAALRPLRHGFFTRKGGASSGVFGGLNCGAGSSDQSDMVRINRARVAEARLAAAGCTVLGFDNVMPLFSVWHESAALGCEVDWGDSGRRSETIRRVPGTLSFLTPALRREIRIGSQNSEYYEVLSGLEPGEKCITSSYDHFGDIEKIVFEICIGNAIILYCYIIE